MHCPFCGNEETQVKDSRMCEDGEAIKRRRYCANCEKKFTTLERVVLKEIIVIKKNGEKKLYDKDKVADSIRNAARNSKITEEQIKNLVNEITKEIETGGSSEIKSKDIGELVLTKLKKLDQVAFVRFASVYNSFEGTKDFIDLIKNIK
jgi:transcriptional repressor NrdR